MVERGKNQFSSKFKEELKEEIKQEILQELKNSSDNKKIVYSKEEFSNKEDKKPLKLLITLVLIVLVLDFCVVFFYYNPGFFKNLPSIKNNGLVVNDLGGDCSDGTKNNECSKTKPYYCIGGKLAEAGYTCGCPEGYVLDFQNCRKV